MMVIAWQATQDSFVQDGTAVELAAARQHGHLAVPDQPPPRLEDAWFSSTQETRTASFYSLDAPVVTVCTGKRVSCAASSTDHTIRATRLGGFDVVVSVSRPEVGATAVPLPADLARYWESTPLTLAPPDWSG